MVMGEQRNNEEKKKEKRKQSPLTDFKHESFMIWLGLFGEISSFALFFIFLLLLLLPPFITSARSCRFCPKMSSVIMFRIVINIHTAGACLWLWLTQEIMLVELVQDEQKSWAGHLRKKMKHFQMEWKKREKRSTQTLRKKGQPANTDWLRTQQPTPPLPHLLNISY